jgi:hypothetical protein
MRLCVDCRTVQHGAGGCDPSHTVVDLARADGRDAVHRDVDRSLVTVTSERPTEWRPRLLESSNARLLALGAVLLIACYILADRRHYALAFVAFLGGIFAAGLGASLAAAPSDSTKSTRRTERGSAARAEPPWSSTAETFVGVIVSTADTPSPFGGQCAGWVLEVSLSGVGVMLRDGANEGMSIKLADERILAVPAGMLRIAKRARSDSLDADVVALHLRALELEAALVWDEARVIVLMPGDAVEITAEAAEIPVDSSTGYRDVVQTTFATVDVPVVRRVHSRSAA